MFNLRICAFISAAAFLLSFLIGLISGTTMPRLLIRPLIFALVFFLIPVIIQTLVGRFLPELLNEGGHEDDSDFLSAGSRVNIMEGDNFDYTQASAPAFAGQDTLGARPDDSEEGVGDISELGIKSAMAQAAGVEEIPAGLDQNRKDGYTDGGETEGFFRFEPEVFLTPASASGEAQKVPDKKNGGDPKPRQASGSFDAGGGSEDSLPDLDSMAGAFASVTANEEEEAADYSISSPSKKPSSSKGQEWAEDFNAKDIAMGIRTVLNKDKEG